MNANQLKRGDKIRLAGGIEGEIADNMRGVIRGVVVDGVNGREHGSTYIWDIVSPVITLTPAQQKSYDVVKAAGF